MARTFTLLLVLAVLVGCTESTQPANEPQRAEPASTTETTTMPTLDSISLDFTGWELQQRDDAMAVWADSDGDVLAINFFDTKPDIPAPRIGPDALRDYFRQQTVATRGGIVEVDTVRIHDIDCGRLVVKARQEPTGFTFQGTCVVPRQDFSFVVRVQCQERGTTGMREAAVMVIELPDPEYEDPPEDAPVNPIFPEAKPAGKIKGWFKDPYDSKYDRSALYNLADQQKYDDRFPDHPLSRARRKLARIIKSLEFTSDIINAAEFDGPR